MEQPGPAVTGSSQSEAAANLAQLDKCLEVLKAAKSDTEKFAALMLVRRASIWANLFHS